MPPQRPTLAGAAGLVGLSAAVALCSFAFALIGGSFYLDPLPRRPSAEQIRVLTGHTFWLLCLPWLFAPWTSLARRFAAPVAFMLLLTVPVAAALAGTLADEALAAIAGAVVMGLLLRHRIRERPLPPEERGA